jgi:hypothetical protein
MMINDLNTTSKPSNGTEIWKFVDDISTSEGLIKNSNSNMQSSLDSIMQFFGSLKNDMKLII